jgi:hypothetical protein
MTATIRVGRNGEYLGDRYERLRSGAEKITLDPNVVASDSIFGAEGLRAFVGELIEARFLDGLSEYDANTVSMPLLPDRRHLHHQRPPVSGVCQTSVASGALGSRREMLSPAATGRASPNWQLPPRRSDTGGDSNLTTNSAASLDCVGGLTDEVCAYGIGAGAFSSPAKSMLAYSRSLSRRW